MMASSYLSFENDLHFSSLPLATHDEIALLVGFRKHSKIFNLRLCVYDLLMSSGTLSMTK